MDRDKKCTFWKNVNLLEKEIPNEIQEQIKSVVVESKETVIKGAKIFCREAKPLKENNIPISILLLHGAAFSSKTWLDLDTIQNLAAMGYHSVAIDLPGFANSPSANVDKQTFLHHVVQTFNLTNPVVISPSLSGLYSLPYLVNYWQNMGGYIPVAPVGIDILEKMPSNPNNKEKILQVPEYLRNLLPSTIPDLDKYMIPTMVVFGEKDRQRNSAILCLLPCSQAAEIPKGKHPAYLDNPNLWHKLLYNFLEHISNMMINDN